MENQPCRLETDSFSTERSDREEHGTEPVCPQAQAGKGVVSQQTAFSSGVCSKGADGQEAPSVGRMSGFAVFDAVSARLVRTLEVEPSDPAACSAEMVFEWCSSFGRVHCITHSVSSRLRVTVTYLDSRDCERAKDEFAKLYPAIAVECSSDEPDHDLTGAVPGYNGYSSGDFQSLMRCCNVALVCVLPLSTSTRISNDILFCLVGLRAEMRGFCLRSV